MPGMTSNPGAGTSVLVSAFQSALLHQWLIIMIIFAVLLLAWGTSRAVFLAPGAGNSAAGAIRPWREPRARRVLRVGFGVIWLFDGLLQAQPQMPGGLADQVIKPTAASSPGWVQHLVNAGVNIWDYHPVEAAAASVWIQVGIGMWLLLAVRGWPARLAGLSSVAWGLIVWAFGEAFGGIFAPGLTALFGAPGAVLIYVLAGALIALPERAWDRPARLGRLLLGGTGAFFLGMALLQAWPGRGFWEGGADGQPGSLAAMISSMAGTSQPHPIAVIVSWFGNFTASHGFAVNLVAVIALALIGGGLGAAAVRADARLARIVVIAGTAFCLADWLLIEDLGFFGGLGTDPNSMIPFILLFAAGYLAVAPDPAPALAAAAAAAAPTAAAADIDQAPAMLSAPVPENPDSSAEGRDPAAERPTQAEDTADPAPTPEGPAPAEDAAEPDGAPGQDGGAPQPAGAPRRAGRVPELLGAFARTPVQVIAGIGALGIILVGAAPMASASVNRNADLIVAQSIAGDNGLLNAPAPSFTLTSQDGRQVSLASLRGKVVLLTFLDPVCTTDCPLIAQEMRSADTMLGGKAGNTELVAVVANPTYLSTAYTRAFTAQENLSQVPNWLFLTGSLSQLTAVWHDYGIEVEDLPAGAMAAHNDLAFVIDASGQMQQEISDDPGPGTAATTSSFAGLLANSVLQTMGNS
jgi:cytochrome oxidase Cu insertion factor (SCO1/SenC/PrrC family)